MRRLLALLAALLLLFGAAACSSDSDDKADDEESTTTTEEATDDEDATEDEDATDDEDAGDASEADYVDAMLQALTDEDSPISEDEAQCVAEGVIGKVDLDAVAEAGITPDDVATDGPSAFGSLLDESQAEDIAVVFVDCIESPGEFFAAAGGFEDPAVAECIDENLSEEDFIAFVTAGILSQPGEDMPDDIAQIFADLQTECADAGAGPTG